MTAQDILTETKKRMKASIEALKRDMASVRTGRASASILDPIKVEFYGALTPLNQLATIGVPEPSLLAISPFDKSAIKPIETAILKSELGLNPANDGHIIRLPIPPLTQERRKELVRHIGKLGEEAKTAIRNLRRDANEQIKKLEKDKKAPLSEDAVKKSLDQIQKATDEHIKEVDEVLKHKEVEIMKV